MSREGTLPPPEQTFHTKEKPLFASVIVKSLSLLAPGTAVSLLGCWRKNSHLGLRKWLQSHQVVTKARDSRECGADCLSQPWLGLHLLLAGAGTGSCGGCTVSLRYLYSVQNGCGGILLAVCPLAYGSQGTRDIVTAAKEGVRSPISQLPCSSLGKWTPEAELML
jgi:hypothetical protein